MKSWRLAVVPTLALSLAVMIGAIAQYTPTKDAYYLLGLLASGYTSFAIAKRLKHEAIRRMELERKHQKHKRLKDDMTFNALN